MKYTQEWERPTKSPNVCKEYFAVYQLFSETLAIDRLASAVKICLLALVAEEDLEKKVLETSWP